MGNYLSSQIESLEASVQANSTLQVFMSRQGGKLKPLKAPKKEKKDEDEDDKAFKEKKKADEAALKAAKGQAAKGGAPGGGIKKYVKHYSWWLVVADINVFLDLPGRNKRCLVHFRSTAREQHFLSPSYPLDLSLPISTIAQYPTSFTHSANASWSQTTADHHGTIHVSHPSIPWDQLRATDGWAALQHLNVLRGWLSVYLPSNISPDVSGPLLRVELLQGAFFTILPPPDSQERRTHVPEWHHGNIYTLERAPGQLVRLPVQPARNVEQTKYEVIICAPYEIRLFGDPSAYSSSHPILTLNFSVSLQFPYFPMPSPETDGHNDAPLQHIPAHSIAPHVVDGTPFGQAIGIGVQSLDFGRDGQGYWSIVRFPHALQPTQTRIIPLLLSLSPLERIPASVKQLDVELTYVSSSCVSKSANGQPPSHIVNDAQPTVQSTFTLHATLPLTHVPLWTQEEHIPVHASFFFADSMPSIYLVKPPKVAFGESQIATGQHDIGKCRGNEPILALHGAGVDILTQSFWPDSLPRQKYAWVVMPQGRTAWGLDWHGPSTEDAFGAVSALSCMLSSGRWAKWGFDPNTRVILMGHSNGGQGAWHMASRWPDRVCAVVPAAGYIKSQAYVSWSMSRFAHFIDPALRAVLDTSLTPDDNDLYLGNLVSKPVLALNGGADDNVPPWQTREQVGILKTWDPSADVMYHEDPGRPHWYFEILNNQRVQAFLDQVYRSACARSASGDDYPRGTRLCVWVATRGDINGMKVLTIDDDDIPIDHIDSVDTILFVRGVNAAESYRPSWKVRLRRLLEPPVINHQHHPQILPPCRLCVPFQRLQSILSSAGPMTLLIPSLQPSPELSAALRIAHALQLFHALDTQIISVPELETDAPTRPVIHTSNLVVIGCAETPLVRRWLARPGGLWTYADRTWRLGTTRFDRPSSGAFCSLAESLHHPDIADCIKRTTTPFLGVTRPSDPILSLTSRG
ncbi:hypothetical protein JVU11DRAFT_244 [Chiua virens]|nr:hypothetical protein JVU11DRAFT_244 [Chiua virens]